MDGDRDIIRDDLRHAEPADAKAAILAALPRLTNTTDIADVLDAVCDHLDDVTAENKRRDEEALARRKARLVRKREG